MTISRYLRDKDKTTAVGILRRERVEIPKEINVMDGRESPSTLYAYIEDLIALLISCVIQKKPEKRNVLVLSILQRRSRCNGYDWRNIYV